MQNKALSKTLSYVLRHKPEEFGLALDAQGWVSVAELLRALQNQRHEVTPEQLNEVVATNDKQRFSLSADGTKIRANQGHSVAVDLGLTPITPPELLYHGTATRFLASIRKDGLRSGSRQHVHLSADAVTAEAVGRRHGKPVVLTVQASRLHRAGGLFYLSANGVWLTEAVPAEYLQAEDSCRM
ncbi:putative RNA 2'-phosphotransferase [Hymenobacter qilianensis]|uniref:RNA 2'-phosphotransferase n=2 Tax=Hymenobacter qilianensis TaxID=1385715 RepID=A0ACB5PQR7_9BACT|nr:RNA 2'-phosphotransferase [Hymenobacter qilianensis]QNP51916.1 RNA 2'-phosphotransferase [Hymenobacter qilianensis]GGF62836.1 putative RNA 2'-phosphotransferase [Hymenobacter qilianensis]